MKVKVKKKKLFVSLATLTVTAVICFLISKDCFFGIDSRSVMSFFGVGEFSAAADNYPFSVHFINVGTADSILIKCGDSAALVDTGNLSLNQTTRHYLQHCGVKKLDLFVATHTDSDHIGDFSSIADYCQIDKIFLSDYGTKEKTSTEAETDFYKKISEYHIKTVSPEIQSYPLGAATIHVLSPNKEYAQKNDNSIVLQVTYQNISVLLTGDAGEAVENDILAEGVDIHSTVLKVSHHGSKYASTQKFLNAVSPETAVISVGTDNKYLPDRKTVDRLNECAESVWRTDKNGSIIVVSDGKSIKTFTEY